MFTTKDDANIISKVTVNASRLKVIIMMTRKRVLYSFRDSVCLTFLQEHSTEQRDLKQNYCERDCFNEFLFKICSGVTFLFPEKRN